MDGQTMVNSIVPRPHFLKRGTITKEQHIKEQQDNIIRSFVICRVPTKSFLQEKESMRILFKNNSKEMTRSQSSRNVSAKKENVLLCIKQNSNGHFLCQHLIMAPYVVNTQLKNIFSLQNAMLNRGISEENQRIKDNYFILEIFDFAQ